MLLNIGQKSIHAEYYDVARKLTFDLLGINYNEFIFIVLLEIFLNFCHNWHMN